MNLDIRLPSNADKWTVIRAIASILHDDDFQPRASEERMNFNFEFKKSTVAETRNSGAILTIPDAKIGGRFLRWVKEHPIKIGKDKLKFFRSSEHASPRTISTLSKTFYTDPDVEERHEEILRGLEDRFRIEAIQIGVFHRPSYPTSSTGALGPRDFSIEWEKICTGSGPSAWLTFKYDHKYFRITMQSISEAYGHAISVEFASIQKMAVGYDPKPYICLDLLYPPTFEETDNSRWRLRSIEPSHQAISPYAHQLRLLLWSGERNDVIKDFVEMCKTAGLTSNITLVQLYKEVQIQAFRSKLFSQELIYKYESTLRRLDLPWPVTFQLASLLHNGVLHTNEILDIIPLVQQVHKTHPEDSQYTGDFLKRFHETLLQKAERESPKACFHRVLKGFQPMKPKGSQTSLIRAAHVTVTPTRMLLQGPFPTQSNNAIRKYEGCDSHFIRVDFRDENGLPYRRNQDVDDMEVLKERVGDILKNGIPIAGRHFQFLAYSTSSLREHAVWFMSSFESGGEMITPKKVVQDLGDFSALSQQPSKYAARIAQKFSATDPSVLIHRHEWECVDDIEYIEERTTRNSEGVMEKKPIKHCFTDGVGTISESLGQEIFEKLRNKEGHLEENAPPPSAYQIRFMGSKGVVAVDKQLDKNSNGIRMRLRPSMIKFPSLAQSEPLEISESFRYPKLCYLNRPLVMVLEDLGVRVQTLLDLQNASIAEAQTIDDSLEQFRNVMEAHRGGLGRSFDFPAILKHFEEDGLDLHSKMGRPGIDNQFIRQLRNVARIEVLREIKHSARIKIPDSYLLVGVADEGPAYRKAGHGNVYELPEGHIYACVQKPEDKEPTWLSGSCSISRSPVTHPGDVQRVRAIGKPPDDKLCLFSHLVNVVVLPSVGRRSLASCLGGGDLDGDTYAIIMYEPLLPTQVVIPASYDSDPPRTLKPDQSIEEAVCDFIVEYIHSDVLGLLSNRLLVIADQSKEGIFDENCEYIAELCSKAVDYPKQGNAVDISDGSLPRPLMRCKPDWQSAEINTRQRPDYYKSERALGEMFRDHRLEVDGPLPEMEKEDKPAQPLLSDPISLAYKHRVQYHIGTAVEPSEQEFMPTLFQKYVAELSYICAMHTLSNSRSIRLREEEVVAGTILASSQNKRMRRDKIERVKVHSRDIVNQIRRELRAPGFESPDDLSPDEWLAGQRLTLERAWQAWAFSLKLGNEFGANSFGLIALGSIFHSLDSLEGKKGQLEDVVEEDDEDLDAF